MPSGLMGGQSSSSSNGYSALSPKLKKAFDPFGEAINKYTLPGNEGVNEAFTPLGQTAQETTAINSMTNGFTPTADSLRRDIDMQMNPYMESVIGGVNREAQGQNSILRGSMADAGQMGSNRSILGENDIENTRLMGIGQLLGGQFNNAMGNAMNVLPGQRAADAAGQMGIGEFLRTQDFAQKQVPIAALREGTSLMAPFISGNGKQTSQTTNGILPMMMNAAAAATAYSDPRLKENIKAVGTENGHNIYEFTYRGYPERRYIGVMADEVAATRPDAVEEVRGYLAVDYNKIGVRFREAS